MKDKDIVIKEMSLEEFLSEETQEEKQLEETLKKMFGNFDTSEDEDDCKHNDNTLIDN